MFLDLIFLGDGTMLPRHVIELVAAGRAIVLPRNICIVRANLLPMSLRGTKQSLCEEIASTEERRLAMTTEFGYGWKPRYVLNFGKSATFKRKVFDNERKGSLH